MAAVVRLGLGLRPFGARAYVVRVCDVVAGRAPPSEPFSVRGRVTALRKMKRNVFVDVDDGSCAERVQICVDHALAPDRLARGCSVEARGRLSKTPRGEVEVAAESIAVVGECEMSEMPVDPDRVDEAAERLRAHPHLRPRSSRFASLLRIRDSASSAVRAFFKSKHFALVDAPALTSNDCEGAGETFRVTYGTEGEYFGSKTYLSVSGQLHLEAAAAALGRVYCFGPTFRAENSRSRLHLSEFYMVEAEQAYATRLETVARLVEDLVKSATATVANEREEDLRNVGADARRLDESSRAPFDSVTYEDAFKILREREKEMRTPLVEGQALGKEHELLLVDSMGGKPTFVTDWPERLKPFYMKRIGDGKVAALDLLVPVTGELAGGSLREDDYEELKKRLPASGMDWYLELRKFGCVPTGGFGLGFERYLQFVCNIANIKDTIPFPRWPHNCSM